jgi:hypothetical protein
MAIKKDKLTDQQKAELERLRPFIARQGLMAQMNSGDWRAALDAVLAIEGCAPRYRLRQVKDTQDPPAGLWQGPLPQGLPLYNFIEWLELETRPAKGQDFGPAIAAALAAAGIPHRVGPGGVRILAYRRTRG